MNHITELIKNRRSVRTFDGRALSDEHRRALEEHIQNSSNPFGVPVELRMLDAKEYGLSSPVILGTDQYLAGKVQRVQDCEMAFGYVFEEACLYAKTLGIGTVMLAASLSRGAFEKAMGVEPDEVLPCASPVGYPAEKMSVRERAMRRALKSDQRQSFDSLFFSGSFDTLLSHAEAGIFFEALELLRWAPSAGNGQPWRAVVDGKTVHFYVYHSMRENKLGDVQKVDVGIGLCHFDLAMREQGAVGRFLKKDPGIPTGEKLEHMISCEVTN